MATFNDHIVEATSGGVNIDPSRRSVFLNVTGLVLALFFFSIPLLQGDSITTPTPHFMYVVLGVFIVVSAIYHRRQHKIIRGRVESIMQRLAESTGGTYFKKSAIDSLQEKAAIFHQGYPEYLMGAEAELDGKRRFMFYRYAVGDNDKKVFNYFIYSIDSGDHFPHMYLNYRKNKFHMELGELLQTSAEFDNNFRITIAPGYHIEALSIFTPDVLALLLDMPYKCDVEIVEGEMLFIIEAVPTVLQGDKDKLRKELDHIEKIHALLASKIERTKWAPIGDRPHHIGIHSFLPNL